jgi:hypothetical protein
MSGCRRAFIDIDTSVRCTIKFGDGSEVAIEGSGTVLFEDESCLEGVGVIRQNLKFTPFKSS